MDLQKQQELWYAQELQRSKNRIKNIISGDVRRSDTGSWTLLFEALQYHKKLTSEKDIYTTSKVIYISFYNLQKIIS